MCAKSEAKCDSQNSEKLMDEPLPNLSNIRVEDFCLYLKSLIVTICKKITLRSYKGYISIYTELYE